MQEHQKRVVCEKVELDDKRQKLTDFLKTEIFAGLLPEEADLLERQLVVMSEYSMILGDRIAAFPK